MPKRNVYHQLQNRQLTGKGPIVRDQFMYQQLQQLYAIHNQINYELESIPNTRQNTHHIRELEHRLRITENDIEIWEDMLY
jgi:hypothetical protein